MKVAIALLVVLSAVAAPVRAQTQVQVPVPSLEQRSEEISKWLKEYREWEQWFEVWGNRVARNASDFLIWERKQRPHPPAWLADACGDELVVDEQLATACHILRTWDDQPIQIIQRRGSAVRTSAGNTADTVVKSSFFHRVHLTGLWTRAQYPGTPVYGLVGMQISVFETGRLMLPATGVMLVMVADGGGGYDLRPASTLSFGYRLFDFVPPMHKKPVSLHLNVARSHIHGLRDDRLISGTANISFVGFSVSRRRHR